MKHYMFLFFVAGCCCGCNTASDVAALKSALRVTGEQVAAKQDESLTILKENTTALAAIKSQVEGLNGSILETRQALGTMEASLVKSEPQKLGGDPVAIESPKAAQANPPQSTQPVALPSVARFSPLKMSWDINGNWDSTIDETAVHLRDSHGVSTDGMSHQEMHDLHASLHNGQSQVAMKSRSVQIVTRGSNCPNGRCPQQNTRMRWRRR